MLQWKEELSVRIDEVDEQHKKLLEIGNSINELLKEYNGQDTYDEIVRLVDELSDYTVYHFEQEENLLMKYEYPELAKHQEEHKKFIDYLNGLDYHHIDENQQEVLKELLDFVISWIFKHIMNTDFQYSDYIIEKMS